jgi:hypothetical protein
MRTTTFIVAAIALAIAAHPARSSAQSAKELPCVGYATFERNGSDIQLLGLAVSAVPAGSKITLKCSGSGCPWETKSINVKSAATVALTDMFIDSNLRPGMIIELRVTKPGWIGKLFQYEIRSSGEPKSTDKCISEDGSQIMACLKEGNGQR